MQRERRAFLKGLSAGLGLAAVDRQAFSDRTTRSSAEAGLERVPIEHGFMLRARRYAVRYQEAEIPFLEIMQGGLGVFRLPAVCGLWSPNGKELITDLSLAPLAQGHSGRYGMHVEARSSLWTGRSFDWSFYPDHIEFQHHARGTGALGRCFFSRTVFLRTGTTEPALEWPPTPRFSLSATSHRQSTSPTSSISPSLCLNR